MILQRDRLRLWEKAKLNGAAFAPSRGRAAHRYQILWVVNVRVTVILMHAA
ncbi:MAG TPA: hypothetical protein VFE47_14620 [Tepidisphaeraceae bacterium]|jgi:hypothetical protein|nr:hypothetical protein [Tepidisphaeraceae bacterium]